jgi:hypothetical protein
VRCVRPEDRKRFISEGNAPQRVTTYTLLASNRVLPGERDSACMVCFALTYARIRERTVLEYAHGLDDGAYALRLPLRTRARAAHRRAQCCVLRSRIEASTGMHAHEEHGIESPQRSSNRSGAATAIRRCRCAPVHSARGPVAAAEELQSLADRRVLEV